VLKSPTRSALEQKNTVFTPFYLKNKENITKKRLFIPPKPLKIAALSTLLERNLLIIN